MPRGIYERKNNNDPDAIDKVASAHNAEISVLKNEIEKLELEKAILEAKIRILQETIVEGLKTE